MLISVQDKGQDDSRCKTPIFL